MGLTALLTALKNWKVILPAFVLAVLLGIIWIQKSQNTNLTDKLEARLKDLAVAEAQIQSMQQQLSSQNAVVKKMQQDAESLQFRLNAAMRSIDVEREAAQRALREIRAPDVNCEETFQWMLETAR